MTHGTITPLFKSEPAAPLMAAVPTGPAITAPEKPEQQSVDQLLSDILTWPRCHDSKSELKFCAWLRAKIAVLNGTAPRVGAHGCIIAVVPISADTRSATLFSCHIDTVDPILPTIDPGKKPWKKKVSFDPSFGQIFLDKDSEGGSLGADDGVGVWTMLKMIEAKVPGSYVFHRGEEKGGIGSNAMLKAESAWLSTHDLAVAFDRGGDTDVVTHQGGLECASDKFGTALCSALNAAGPLDYSLSRGGTFTDTKVYRKIISECVNISVGYEGQHHTSETLDYNHAYALMLAACNIKWDSLPVDRDNTKMDPVPAYAGYGRGSSGKWGGYNGSLGRGIADMDYGLFDDDDSGFRPDYKDMKPPVKVATAPPVSKNKIGLTEYDNLQGSSLTALEDWAADNPEETALAVAKLLLEISALRAREKVLYSLAGLDDI